VRRTCGIRGAWGRDVNVGGTYLTDECRDPHKVKNGYTADSIWRNRDTFLKGTDEIVEFLTKKWSKENGYRLRKELFAFTENKVRLMSRAFIVRHAWDPGVTRKRLYFGSW
jgi:nuclear transport factor 2 (NTF2) superfamily protein